MTALSTVHPADASIGFDTIRVNVSRRQAHQLAPRLIDEGPWFSMTPLPFDRYEVRVKPEWRATMQELMSEVRNG